MHIFHLKPSIDSQSRIHGLDARVKLLLVLGYLLGIALLPPGAWLALGGFATLLWWSIKYAHLSVRMIVKQSVIALPFALVAISVIFMEKGDPLLSFALNRFTFTITTGGVIRFVTIVVKSWLSVQSVLLMNAITPMLDVFRALRSLQVPGVLVTILSFTYRYLFVLIEEAQRLARARDSRSAAMPDQRAGGSLIWRTQVLGHMVGTLFLRSYERSERIYGAMLSRGYGGEIRSLTNRSLTSREYTILFAGLCALFVITLLGFL